MLELRTKIKDNFIIIDYNVCRKDGKVNSMVYDNEYLLGVVSYLSIHSDGYSQAFLNINDLVTELGYKPDRHKGKINSKIKDTLQYLVNIGCVECLEDINTIRADKYFKVFVDTDILLSKKEGKKNNFAKLDYKVIDKIFKSETKHKKTQLFNVYVNLLSRKFPHEFNGNIKCEMCFPSLEQISEDINMSINTIKLILKELQELKLVFYDTIGDIKSDMNGFITANNVYVFKKEDLENALTLSRKHYYESGFFETKNRKQLSEEEKAEKNRRKVRKSRLKKKINEGKATQEEIEEYEQLCNFTNKNKINQQNNNNNNTKEEQIYTWEKSVNV